MLPSWKILDSVLPLLLCATLPAYAQSGADGDVESVQPASGKERIVTPEEVQAATSSGGTTTLAVIGWPYRQLMRGMRSGLVTFEKHKIQQKISAFQAGLNARGIGLLYGGLGEGSGFGFGMTQEIPPRPGARARDYLRDERIVGLPSLGSHQPVEQLSGVRGLCRNGTVATVELGHPHRLPVASRRAVLRFWSGLETGG